jgi:hypothetical protein
MGQCVYLQGVQVSSSQPAAKHTILHAPIRMRFPAPRGAPLGSMGSAAESALSLQGRLFLVVRPGQLAAGIERGARPEAAPKTQAIGLPDRPFYCETALESRPSPHQKAPSSHRAGIDKAAGLNRPAPIRRGALSMAAPKGDDWPPQGAVVAGVTRASQVPKGKADIQSSPKGEIARKGAAVRSFALMASAVRLIADGTRREGPSWSARSQAAIGSAPAPRQSYKTRHSGKGNHSSRPCGR